jgi:hypothetical protein
MVASKEYDNTYKSAAKIAPQAVEPFDKEWV